MPRAKGKQPEKASELLDTRLESRQYPHIVKRNAECSPFLRLPAEIRNRIYEEALGNRTVHIGAYECPPTEPGAFTYREHRFSGQWAVKLTYVICRAKETESEVYCRSLSCHPESGCQWNTISTYAERHRACLSGFQNFPNMCAAQERDPDGRLCYDTSREMIGALQREDKLQVGLLRVCQQIHREAALIPYETNIFAFTEGYDFEIFVSDMLMAQQRKALTSIQVGGYMHHRRLDPRIHRNTVLSLKDLTSLEITLDQEEEILDFFSEENNKLFEDFGEQSSIDTGIDQFFCLGIKKEAARVLITPPVGDGKFSWKAFHRQECNESCFEAKDVQRIIEQKIRHDCGDRARYQRAEDEAEQVKLAEKQRMERKIERKRHVDEAFAEGIEGKQAKRPV